MSRMRAYTRKELESLRRADLQRLFKLHDLKGANQKSDVLITHLLQHFASPAFSLPPASHPSKGDAREARRLRSIEVPQRWNGAGQRKDAVTGGIQRGGVKMQRTATVNPMLPPRGIGEQPETLAITTTAAAAGVPRSVSPQFPRAEEEELDALRQEIETLRHKAPSGLTEARVAELLRAKDEEWAERIRQLEEEWQARLRAVEDQVAELVRQAALWGGGSGNGQGALHPLSTRMATSTSMHSMGKPDMPEVTVTEGTPAERAGSNKRRAQDEEGDAEDDEGAFSEGHGMVTPGRSLTARKRARTYSPARDDGGRMDDADGDESVQSEPHLPRTPSPPPRTPRNPSTHTFKTPLLPQNRADHMSLPRTPSPGQLHHAVGGAAPGNDYFAPPPPAFSPPPSSAARKHGHETLPFPLFATTPRPSEPRSPTTDAPPSISRGRAALGTALTPGRVPAAAPRAVSAAHLELHSITDSTSPPGPGSAASRRVHSLDTRLLAPGACTPPRHLSPSPTIDSPVSLGRQAGMPANPRRRDMPERAYMEVALLGLGDDADDGRGSGRHVQGGGGVGGGVLGTPGQRTMLGTERYRDTRFGDVEVVSWGTPRVDLGEATPRS